MSPMARRIILAGRFYLPGTAERGTLSNIPSHKKEARPVKRCFIFAAGTFYGLRERPVPGDFVIAADAGYRTC